MYITLTPGTKANYLKVLKQDHLCISFLHITRHQSNANHICDGCIYYSVDSIFLQVVEGFLKLCNRPLWVNSAVRRSLSFQLEIDHNLKP